MKTKPYLATYESPMTTLLNMSSEGVLCSSTQKFGWSEDNVLDDFAGDFSDWSK